MARIGRPKSPCRPSRSSPVNPMLLCGHGLQVLQQLRAETAAVNGAHMQVTPEQGALLGLLVELLGCRWVSCAVPQGIPSGGGCCTAPTTPLRWATGRAAMAPHGGHP